MALLVGGLTKLVALELDLVIEELVLRTDRDILADGHAEATRKQTRDAREDDGVRVMGRRAGDAHDQAHVDDETVGGAKHGRAQHARAARLVGLDGAATRGRRPSR
jgi:hypothetical protein